MDDSSINDSIEEREAESEERQSAFLRQRSGAENASGRRSRRDSEVSNEVDT